MKTVFKINPEKEYEIAKNMIEIASQKIQDTELINTLDSSVNNLITAARVLMEREERRRGKPNPPAKNPSPKGRQKGEEREDAKKLPSQRYPDLEVREEVITPEHRPTCSCCQQTMKESGLFEVSEKLEVSPKKYFIQRNKRVKFNCPHCYGSLVTTPAVPSIVPGSNYGDSLILDVGLSKYCDLIPMERYAQIAMQMGLDGELPAQSLIGLTHHLANFLLAIYHQIKHEVLSSLVVLGDETPHKMLEGDETKNWYLWGFFTSRSCYFELHDTRSGDVVLEFLKESKAQVLLTDGYAGYGRAVRQIKEQSGRQIQEAHCNAHAFRYFDEASLTWKEESDIFLKLYGEIYDLEAERKKPQTSLETQHELREKMQSLFEEMRAHCQSQIPSAMPGSQLQTAMNYFLNHYEGLTLCVKNLDIPLDNNFSERQLRAPVVGRKTWYGTHSKRGAQTAAVLFSIIQSCKAVGVNPRSYLPWVVRELHEGKGSLTPYQYSLKIASEPETQ